MKSVFVLCFFAAGAAFAGQHRTLSFDQLRVACQEPSRFQNQMKPANIKITCSDRIQRWVPAGTSTMTMPSERMVQFQVSSDKYTVPGDRAIVDAPAMQAECPVLKQVEEVTTISKDISCDEIEEYRGTAASLCVVLLDGLRGENPGTVEVRETGRVASFCSPGGHGRGHGHGGRGHGHGHQGQGHPHQQQLKPLK